MHRIVKRKEPGHLKKWKEDFLKKMGREPGYEDLAMSEEYGRLKQELLEEQGYICCYCEKEIGVQKGDHDIEHFMPRHPDKKSLTKEECRICQDAQLDYGNMMVSCKGERYDSLDHCNHKKDNWFDFSLCVSPTSLEAEGLFGFRLNGKIFALHNDCRAEEMKKRLNLDTYVLQEQRKAAYDQVVALEFGENEELWNDQNYVAETIEEYRRRNIWGRYYPFCSMITYCLKNYMI
ncbi:MAG: hypothetical protein KHZ10_06905 [Clostridium sp.]|nr:hypothetical protein [Clostridium sp.]